MKEAIRCYGVLTSALRPLPDFLVIGAKRGGTTSLYRYLLQHPLVRPLFPAMEDRKGIDFFDRHYARGAAWYRSHFPATTALRWAARRRAPGVAGARCMVGEASPYYLFHPTAAERASLVTPRSRILVLLRNPVDRAYSHYLERVRNRDETLSFEEALARESERLAGEVDRIRTDQAYYSHAHEHHSYRSQGLYREPLGEWLSRFPTDRVRVLVSEELFSDPAGTHAAVLEFLGLPPRPLRSAPAYNLHPSRPMAPATRAELTAFYEPHNRELAAWLGRDLPWS